MKTRPRYPGIRVTTNGNELVSRHTEARIADGGVFYPITPSTEMGEMYQEAFATGKLNVFGQPKLAVEAEGEHAAQGGAVAFSVTGKRTVNFTSGQGVVYALEQYYHAPGKCSTMVVEVAARALTKHALNVHCGHDDIYAAMDTGWIILFAKDAQQAADQALILRRVTELSLTPGINTQDGFLTSHLERTFFMHESELIREFLGAPDDIIDCPTEAQRKLFGPKRRRVPQMIDLTNPILLGPVQNQEHYMNGVVARRNNFAEPIMKFLEEAYDEFAELTGRSYGLISKYRTEDADFVYISLGSAAENIEAAVDYLRETRQAKVGSIHVNVLRPFPTRAIVEALRGKTACMILERTDEPLAGDNPLARDVRTALTKSYIRPGFPHREGMAVITHEEIPRNFTGVYGLGSRDFRPEHIIGVYEYVAEEGKRQDGKGAADGVTHFNLGVDHPYAVVSDDQPSLLPAGAIAVRLHSIGGWGMITTGKNLGEIIGHFGESIARRENEYDDDGRLKEVLHISANPKYGSEKKGAPTSYFLVVAPERIRVNCDLRHVTVVLCCDPKAFTHINPLDGLTEGGAFVWESAETPELAWERIPQDLRRTIIDKKIRLYTLPGFEISHDATPRPELQLRMQGNAFLGAFFRVSPFLEQNGIDQKQYRDVVRKQYEKKFGRFGDAVVEANMQVMTAGFERVREVPYGPVEAEDRSSMRGLPMLPQPAEGGGNGGCDRCVPATGQPDRAPVFQVEVFDKEFRAGLGYHQPASTLASVGIMASATGATASKYGARRETPVFIAENCTQCMECIAVCPDTALPNTAQDISTVLQTAVRHYVTDGGERRKLMAAIPEVEQRVRSAMLGLVKAKEAKPFKDLVRQEVRALAEVSEQAKEQLFSIIDILPLAYTKSNAIFSNIEKKNPGNGGLFAIFVSDLCKGCAECVTECGSHQALRMEPDSEELNTRYATTMGFFDLLPDTRQKFLGLYDDDNPQDSRAATLRNHLMVRRNYEALASGDGACAGCGEKSVLRAVASVTEAYMRPLYHAKADRLRAKADQIEKQGSERLSQLAQSDRKQYDLFRRAVAHTIMGLGGESPEDTQKRIAEHGQLSDREIIDALVSVMRQDAFNHKDLQAVDGRLANGMSVMAMGACTGCNTVYGSTPPNNPHPYPWMNSLFQDGATITWIMGESFIMDHARRSVVPERLADALLQSPERQRRVGPHRDGEVIDEQDYFDYTHMTDTLMTDQEIIELPKAWAIGGDGGFGDIGFQNVSKVVLQNRPNVKMLMLDTQVYSNTGGQNSDSSPLPGGFDMNQLGAASQGKLIEKKGLAETFTSGHGSPYVAQVSMANAAKLYRVLLDALEYRGTAFLQCFTTCQPEHGVADDVATIQAKRIRDSRGIPEFIFNPSAGESYTETLDLKGNPTPKADWWTTQFKATRESYRYTVAHWAATEARFRRHFKRIGDEEAAGMIDLQEMLPRITQNDVVCRRHLNKQHRSYVPDFGVYIKADVGDGKVRSLAISRQMVLFCVERRKSWRLLQSKAGVENLEYQAQRALLAKVDAGEIPLERFLAGTTELFRQELVELQSPPAGK
ncbi:MAG: 2-oxoacid:acceptor oxidoreductase family protein [Phycisphaerae bacterium]